MDDKTPGPTEELYKSRALPFISRIEADDVALILALATSALADAIVAGDKDGAKEIQDFVQRVCQDTDGLYDVFTDKVARRALRMVIEMGL